MRLQQTSAKVQISQAVW